MIKPWPDHLRPNAMDWHLQANTKTFTSSFNNSIRTASFPGEQWIGTMTFNRLSREKARDLEVFVRSLSGASGRFLLRDLKSKGRPAKGVPVVAQADQTGGLLLTSGWLPNQLVMRAGDYFSVGDELKQSKVDVLSSASGTAILEFYPWLRHTPSVGAAIITDRPAGIFRLSDDRQGKLSNRPEYSDTTIEVIEAFYV
ncbi:hypothetical protein ACN26P_003395 [Vibrio cholerae]|nr:hypothetical protein [Vibrio cholerae]